LPRSLRAAEEAALLVGFFSHVDLSDAPNVAGYSPINDELDCGALLTELRARNCRILLPVCPSAQQPLQFRVSDGQTALVEGRYGIAEPPETAEMVEPDILIIPLVAFDRHGTRAGYGAGYYDRTLRLLRARGSILALGLAFTTQCVEDIPAEPTDEVLDCVLTGNGMTWFNENHVRRIPAQ